MISIKSKWIAIFLVILIYNPVYAELEKSRITQIISLTQENNTESSMLEQSEKFVNDLRERLPHLSEKQLESMKEAYEDAILEGEMGTYTNPMDTKEQVIKKIEPAKAIESIESIESIEKEDPPKENKIMQRIRNHFKKNPVSNRNPSSEEDNKTLIEESKRTIILLTVEKGDTLSDIAKRNYQDASMYIVIYEANKDKLKSPNRVPEGIILKVPEIDSSNKDKFHKMVREYEKTHR